MSPEKTTSAVSSNSECLTSGGRHFMSTWKLDCDDFKPAICFANDTTLTSRMHWTSTGSMSNWLTIKSSTCVQKIFNVRDQELPRTLERQLTLLIPTTENTHHVTLCIRSTSGITSRTQIAHGKGQESANNRKKENNFSRRRQNQNNSTQFASSSSHSID